VWQESEALLEAVQNEPWAKQCQAGEPFWRSLMYWIREQFLPDFMRHFIGQVDEIIDIDPDLPEQEIFVTVNRYMVEFLNAHSSSVRIYDPHTAQMLSYGSYPSDETSREPHIPLEGSVAGAVVKTGQTYLVPNILKEELYHNKDVIQRKGTYSIMAVPLEIPRFSPEERPTVGVIQVYFPEKDRDFNALEIQMAELVAKRLSFVMARKKIVSLRRINEKKETIVRKIFRKLGSREGVKMKDIFDSIIPELADFVNIQSCALFAVTEDHEHVDLEAGFSTIQDYHGIGKRIAISSEPAFQVILNRLTLEGDSPYEVITPSYFLVVQPQKSDLVSQNVKEFVKYYNVNSILYIPLTVGGETTHFMTFDAIDQRQRYTEEEIEIFSFLGRELVKAQRLERLDDILHDLKNPAIATAGFARRLKAMMDSDAFDRYDKKVRRYLNILLEETSRLQEMALSVFEMGEEQEVNLTQVLLQRFEINTEAIKELLKQNVTLQQGPFRDPLPVFCYPLHLERILDNLLNNATNAIPLSGGNLSIRTFIEGDWACAEISNTGQITEEDRLRLLEGEGRGRGLYITHRIIRLLKGKIDVRVGRNATTLVVKLPLSHTTPAKP
jgi:signal transduction histidine kinase